MRPDEGHCRTTLYGVVFLLGIIGDIAQKIDEIHKKTGYNIQIYDSKHNFVGDANE